MKSKLIDVGILVLLIYTALSIPSHIETVEYVWKVSETPVIVLDPGHGGIDGGAEGQDGTSEKDINLNIALKLKEYLAEDGFRVVMTRCSDSGLYEDDGESSIRALKTEDMHERKRIIDETEPDLTVSIHLNSFTQDDTVKGAQVFYPASGEDEEINKSRLAAELIQEDLNKKINTDKKRTAMEKDDVFLFKDIRTPIVIAECGFLSNSNDLHDLKSSEYQEKISKTLKASICKYFDRCE